MAIKVECLPKLGILLQKPKPIKIAVSGRGCTKTTFFSQRVIAGIFGGERWCCAREFLESIDKSVHQDIKSEAHSLGVYDQLDITDKNITDPITGGHTFYSGLARNIDSIKGKLSGAYMWIEEGDKISKDTIRLGFPSVRLPKDAVERQVEHFISQGMTEKKAYESIVHPEIWISMNRGSREDPISKEYLSRAEPTLTKGKVYEDEECIIVGLHHTEVPKKWFMASGLEKKRVADKKRMSSKLYAHVWDGDYLETVENALIQEEWFDACIDAHISLGFYPEGVETVSHDPSDEGEDSKGLAHKHGSVIVNVLEMDQGDVNAGFDWAADYALSAKVDNFIWDEGGLGLGLKRQAKQKFGGKKSISYRTFNGAHEPQDPDGKYRLDEDEKGKVKTNREKFKNQRAQMYRYLADRMYQTYIAVKSGTAKKFEEEELISFSSGIDPETLLKLRSELCKIPVKNKDDSNKFQIMGKDEMRSKFGIPSPNLADSVMMLMAKAPDNNEWGELNYNDEFVA